MTIQAKARRPVWQPYLHGTLFVLAIVALGLAVLHPAYSEEPARLVPAPLFDESPATAEGSEKAVLAGGCFWGVQGVFQHVKGVKSAVSGYSGGSRSTAEYETVSTGTTGHAESVEITYDPKQITYGQLLQIFFSVVHDPTQLNGQGNDMGTQYRSAIFPASPLQQKIADTYIDQLNKAGIFKKTIVTKTDALKGFYPAEGYHQNFLTLHPTHPYIQANDLPKVANLKSLFPAEYRDKPVLVSADG